MRILAFETSGEAGSIALQCEQQTRSLPLEAGPSQSASALARVRQLLAEGGVRLEDLDAIAFSSGPGAFTGLRLGCGLAQGLAMGARLGVVPIGTLDALAAQIDDGQVVAAIDARMGELYWASYRCVGGVPNPMHEACCVAPAGWSLADEVGEVTAIGSAFGVHREALATELLARFTMVLDDRMPAAAEVARLAARRLEHEAALDPALALPFYVRNKVAQTTRERLAQGGRA